MFEAGGCSDHLRGRFRFEAEEIKKKRPFKLANILTKLPQFNPIVEGFWESTPPMFVSTSALHRFSKKLKALKRALRSLGKKKNWVIYHVTLVKHTATYVTNKQRHSSIRVLKQWKKSLKLIINGKGYRNWKRGS